MLSYLICEVSRQNESYENKGNLNMVWLFLCDEATEIKVFMLKETEYHAEDALHNTQFDIWCPHLK